MKPSIPFVLSLCAALLAPLSAKETFKLESVLYVFRDADFSLITLGGATPAALGHGEVITSPARLAFNQHSLELARTGYTWNGTGQTAPAQFSPLAMPAIAVNSGQSASVLCAQPVQYLEKAADGSLQVRQLDRDSPDVPHYQLSFETRPAGDEASLMVSCQLEIAIMSGREKIPGVELDAGRPILARYKEGFHFLNRAGEWSGILLRRPEGGDYSLLLLFKIGLGSTPGLSAGAEPAAGFMTAAELDKFATYYYRNPQPELVPRVIEALGSSGFAEDRAQVFVGFFAEIFAANPGRVPEWRQLIDRQGKPTRALLADALALRHPGDVLALTGHSIRLNDRYWGAFFASGNPAYVRKLADQLGYIDEYYEDREPLFWAGATAMWSLARNAPEHPVVRATLEMIRTETDSRNGKIIGQLFEMDLVALKEDLWRRHSDLKPFSFSLLPRYPSQSN
jgi:hypothetical protein